MALCNFNIEDGVGIIALNRPDVLNSFNLAMANEVKEALDECRDNAAIRAVYLTGEGRAFCAGQDLEEATESGHPIEHFVENTYNPIILKIREIEKPVVCGVNGVAAGAGANIAIACDITYAITSAKFIQSFSNIGLIPDSAGTFTLPKLIGMQRASAAMFLAEKITAEEAEKIGMIYKMLPDDGLEEALNTAKKLAKRPTKGIGLTKRLMNASWTNDLNTQLAMEKELQSEAANSYDYKEGVAAFLEKRKPEYKGQ
ncbi:MAG: enoyl-CoA hydratase-related protein [Bacteroidota bacterium]